MYDVIQDLLVEMAKDMDPVLVLNDIKRGKIPAPYIGFFKDLRARGMYMHNAVCKPWREGSGG